MSRLEALSTLFLTLGLAVSSLPAVPIVATHEPAGRPLRFEVNRGQTDDRVEFLARGNGYTLFLTREHAVLGLGEAVLRMGLGHAAAQSPTGVGELPGRSNYYLGRDPSGWVTGVSAFAAVRYGSVYPGIDLLYYDNRGRLEYDFIVAPRADAGVIEMVFEGAESMELDGDGDLILGVGENAVRLQRPTVYQEHGNVRREIPSAYSLVSETRVRFDLGSYDPERTLVIDPVLSYSTFVGGAEADFGLGIAVDAAGNAYVAGTTTSIDFPVANPLQSPLSGAADAFVTKIAPDGSLVYSTYLGGSGFEFGVGIAVDAAFSAWITGATSSADFPTVDPIQGAPGGAGDVFVSRLDPSGGGLLFSTYLGGSSSDSPNGIALDSAGDAYCVGVTDSADFPTSGAVQPVHGGDSDAFLTKIDAAALTLAYSTYLGGSDTDAALGVAADASGAAYVVGQTASSDFPTANALQGAHAADGGGLDVFVAKLDPAGQALLFSTYLGGDAGDRGFDVAVDAGGNVYLTGQTQSSDFPTSNPIQGPVGFVDAFVTKLSPSGDALAYSTYLGGDDADTGVGIAVDPGGAAFVSGRTRSANFPTADAFQEALGGGLCNLPPTPCQDGFVARLTPSGNALDFSSFLGGEGDDSAFRIAVDGVGNAYVVGVTSSPNFPTVAPFQGQLGGDSDAFVAKIVADDATVPALSSWSAAALILLLIGFGAAALRRSAAARERGAANRG